MLSAVSFRMRIYIPIQFIYHLREGSWKVRGLGGEGTFFLKEGSLSPKNFPHKPPPCKSFLKYSLYCGILKGKK